MYCYSAYQLCLQSEIPLSGLPEAEGEADVVVRLAQGKTPLSTDNADPMRLLYGQLKDVGDCWMSDGRLITIAPFEGIGHDVLGPNVLGGCMSVILRQRGFFVLHASSVSIQGNVVAFLGHSGWGKSTLAAALHSQGHSVITDDILAIDLGHGEAPQLVPSFPQCKLSPEAARALGKDPAALAPLCTHSAKRAYNFQIGFQQERLPLKTIYLLAKGNAHSITSVSPKDAFSHLVSHTRAMGVLNDPQSLQVHFGQCTQLLKQVSCYRFTRRPGLAELPDLVHLVEEHVKETSV